MEEFKRICCLTGAGISAESGIPTFRDSENGLWAGAKIEEVASLQGFKANPEMVWGWYEGRRQTAREAKPNRAHAILAEWEKEAEEFTVITQNIDGLHQRAGSKKVIELHGNLFWAKCLGKAHRTKEWGPESSPRCSKCNSRLRPDVVWFGENLREEDYIAAVRAVKNYDLLLIIGTSGLVQPANSFASLGKTHGAYVIEINPEKTPLTEIADLHLEGKASEVLETLKKK